MDAAIIVRNTRPRSGCDRRALSQRKASPRVGVDGLHEVRRELDAEIPPRFREVRLALAFGGVGLVGFCVDAALLHLGLDVGAAAWAARIVSLFFAMQATFTINRLHVFRDLDRTRLVRQWTGYMLANGFGNFCNYWIFLTLVSTHWPLVSNHYAALAAGSLSAG